MVCFFFLPSQAPRRIPSQFFGIDSLPFFSEYLAFEELICKIKHDFLSVLYGSWWSFWVAAQEKDGVKRYTCGGASTRVLLVYFQLWFLQGSPGISTCNAVTVEHEERLKLMKLQPCGLLHQQNEATGTWGLNASLRIGTLLRLWAMT